MPWNRLIYIFDHHWGDIHAHPVSFDVVDNWIFRNLQVTFEELDGGVLRHISHTSDHRGIHEANP